MTQNTLEKYSRLEKEALAIVFSLKRFHQYLRRKHNTTYFVWRLLVTRHCSLPFALSSGDIGTYVGLYRSGLFNYESYIARTILNSFAYFWSYDVPNTHTQRLRKARCTLLPTIKIITDNTYNSIVLLFFIFLSELIRRNNCSRLFCVSFIFPHKGYDTNQYKSKLKTPLRWIGMSPINSISHTLSVSISAISMFLINQTGKKYNSV